MKMKNIKRANKNIAILVAKAFRAVSKAAALQKPCHKKPYILKKPQPSLPFQSPGLFQPRSFSSKSKMNKRHSKCLQQPREVSIQAGRSLIRKGKDLCRP